MINRILLLRAIEKEQAVATYLYHALFVLQDDEAAQFGRAVLDYLQGEVGDKVIITTTALREVADWAELARTDRYRLIVVSRHVWQEVPKRRGDFPTSFRATTS